MNHPSVNTVEDFLSQSRELRFSNIEGSLRVARKALKLAKAQNNERGIIHSLCSIGQCKIELSQYASALRYMHQALALSQQTNDILWTSRAFLTIGSTYVVSNNPVRAIVNLNEGLKIFNKDDDPLFYPATLRVLGRAYLDINDYAKSLEYSLASIEFFEQWSDEKSKLELCRSLRDTAYIYFRLENFSKSYDLCLKSIELQKENGFVDKYISVYAESLNLLGPILLLMNKNKEAKYYIYHTYQIYKQIGFFREEIIALLNVAWYLLVIKKYRLALKQLQSIVIDTEMQNHNVIYKYNLMAWAYIGLKEYGTALKTLKIIHNKIQIEQTSETPSYHQIKRYYELIVQAYEGIGNMHNAFKAQQQLKEVLLQELRYQYSSSISQLQFRLDIERIQHQKEALQLHNQALLQKVHEKSQEISSLSLNLLQKSHFLGAVKKILAGLASDKTSIDKPVAKELVRQVEQSLNNDNHWERLEKQIEQLHQGFIKKITELYPQLTRMELKICGLLRMGMSSKEIGSILSIAPKSIDIHRYRIRKKLMMQRDQSFISFFAAL